jgi:NodT family efflux transporter outer membrane factor (OMF) lipoprotein
MKKNYLKKFKKMKKHKVYTLLLLISLPIVLSSCFAAKEYKQPEEVVLNEDNFRTDIIVKDSANMAQISWQEIFRDSLLNEYIQEGLQNNIDIRVALQQILAAEAYFKQGKAGYYPTLNGNATAGHQEFSSNSQFGNQFTNLNSFEISGNLSWEIDIWGKIRSQKRAFEASYLQSVAAHRAVKTALIANIATTYYQLLSLDEQIKVTKKTIENRTIGLETTKALKQAGNLTEVAVKQTEAQLYNAQAILIDLQNQLYITENTFAILLGKSPDTFVRGKLNDQKITTDLQIGVPVQLLSNRPDVIAAEFNLKQAFELTNVARSNFYPALTLSASGGLQSVTFENFFDINSLFTSVLGGLTQPLINGRKIKTQYEVSQAQQEQSLLRFKESLLIASSEVSNAMYNYQTSTQKMDVVKKEFEAYQLATQYSEELLNNGMANYLEVLTARENALNSELRLVLNKYSQLAAITELYRSLGGGWQ